jgi:4-carboxymuconolactone decarboxylase
MERRNSMSDIRIPCVVPGTRPELAAIEQKILQERGRISTLYQVLLNSGPLTEGWEALLTAIRNRGSLPARLRELVILRIAVLNGAPYEFDAHVPHAQKAGVPDAGKAALKDAAIPPPLPPLDYLVLELTDAMTRAIEVPDALFERVRARFGDTQLVELVATIAAYNMVSRFLVALRVGH